MSLGPSWLGALRSCLAAAAVGGWREAGSDIHHLITPEPLFTGSACQSLIYDPATCWDLCQACLPLLTLPLVLTTPTRAAGPLPACHCSAVQEPDQRAEVKAFYDNISFSKPSLDNYKVGSRFDSFCVAMTISLCFHSNYMRAFAFSLRNRTCI